jgi:hypothetical protein
MGSWAEESEAVEGAAAVADEAELFNALAEVIVVSLQALPIQ